jgi:ribose transport system permease protein
MNAPFVRPTLALVLSVVLFSVLAPDTFFQASTALALFRQSCVVLLVAVGATCIIAQGGIDLAVGSQVALGTVVVALALRSGFSPVLAVTAAVLLIGATGLLAGGLVTSLGVPPFIVTLALMTLLRGTAKALANEQKVDVEPAGLERLMEPADALFGVAPGVVVALGLAVVVGVALHRTPIGLHVFAVGSSERTARLCGISPARIRLLAYGVGAVLAGVASVLEFATLTVGDPTDSAGLELSAIAASVVGGASLSGGEASIAGTVAGALLMAVVRVGCTHMGLSNWVQEVLTGAIIFGAVAADRFRRRP